MRQDSPTPRSEHYHGTVCSFADYDNDGFMDVTFYGEGNVLYRNVGGTFVDVTATTGIATKRNSTGVAWGDYDNDGLLDLYIARGTTGSGLLGNTLCRNNGDGTFTDVTTAAGLDTVRSTWVAVWGDYLAITFFSAMKRMSRANPF